MKHSFELDNKIHNHTSLENVSEKEKADLASLLDNCAFSVTLNANDTFGYACADSVSVDWADVWMLKEVYDLYGYDGVNAFMSVIRKHDVLPELMTPKYWQAKDHLKNFIPYEDL